MIKIFSMRRGVSWSLHFCGLIALSISLLWAGSLQARVSADAITFDSTAGYEELIVKFRQDGDSRSLTAESAQNRLSTLNQQLGTALKWKRALGSGAGLVGLDTNARSLPLTQLINELEKRSDVEYAVPNIRLYPLFTPDDSRYSEQWHYYESIGGINMPEAWDINAGNGAVIAVVDTGYRPHADLADNIIGGYDFISDAATARDGDGRDADASDEGDWFGIFECPGAPLQSMNSSWHGTHVAGTIAALTNNSQGVAGIAFESKVLPVRVLGKCGGTLSDIMDGMLWAAGLSVPDAPLNPNPARVINLSLGGNAACDAAMQDTVNQIVAAGATVVAAAGNSNADASGFTPAGCDNVLTISATNRNGSRASYSNFGSVVEVAAPGGETSGGSAGGVLSTLNSGATVPENDIYAFYQGTSMATPHAAAVAGLLYSKNAAATPDDITRAMVDSARAFPGSCGGCGAGIIDAAAALEAIDGDGNQPPRASFNVATSGLTASFSDQSSDSDGSVITWQWDFGDGSTSASQNPSHTYAVSGTYSVTLTVTDDGGASDTLTQSVGVSDGSNESPRSDFSFSINGLNVDFTDQSSDADGNVIAWDWDFGDGTVSSEQNPTHSYTSAGSYTVSLTVTDDDGASHSSSQTLSVEASGNITLEARVSSVLFFHNITLNWSNASGDNVDIYRNGSLIATVVNDGVWQQLRIGSGTDVYQVCEEGTSSCSNEAEVSY